MSIFRVYFMVNSNEYGLIHAITWKSSCILSLSLRKIQANHQRKNQYSQNLDRKGRVIRFVSSPFGMSIRHGPLNFVFLVKVQRQISYCQNLKKKNSMR